MNSKFNRTYVNCWDREKIQQVLEERVRELKSTDPKSKSRIKLLRGKITKLKKALEGKAIAGGQIKPNENKKVQKTGKMRTKKNRTGSRKVCFKCRKRGHVLQDCRENDSESICFRCGSKEHTLKDCRDKNKVGGAAIVSKMKSWLGLTYDSQDELPFATCFVCNQTGHLASQCPQNPKGIFPKGSGCHFCGSVRHKKADCPEFKGKKLKPRTEDQDAES